ncbi:uncharacterized protein DMAD_11117 [Drosophila madeirensis]|uniref:MADF domain-containing protein n=1 Tax=Drosophila madeirensis TaxID=30013 RepID=A0AAU9FBZ6_DROMD
MEREKAKPNRRLGEFTDESKIKLIKEVKKDEIIWNLSHKQHSDANGIKCAWEFVAAEMNREIETCRNGWKSLRDSYRYHVKRVAKSGSAGVPIEGPVASDSIDWRFAPHMEFLPDLSSQRRTFFSSSSFALDTPAQLYTEIVDTDKRSWIDSENGLERELSDQSSCESSTPLRTPSPTVASFLRSIWEIHLTEQCIGLHTLLRLQLQNVVC